MLVTLISGGLLFLLLGQMHSMAGICVTAFFLALLNDAFRPANSAAIAAISTPENRTRSFSMNRLAVNLGWAIGGGLGGLVASYSYHALFWIDGLTNILAAALLFLVLSKDHHTQGHRKDRTKPEQEPAYRDRIFMIFIALTILFAICFFQNFSTIPLFYRRVCLIDTSFIGLTMTLNGLMIVALEMPLVYFLEGRFRTTAIIAVGMLLMCVAFVLFNLMPPGYNVAVGFTLLITIGEMLSMPFMNTFWTSRIKAHNPGGYAGWYSAAWSIAQVTGPVLGSLLAYRAGFPALWWLVASVCVLGALGFAFLDTGSRKA
jgi:predicted MFS family arabinose efflux permease